MRDSAKAVPFEEAVGAVIFEAAFEEQPVDAPLSYARLHHSQHLLADAVGAQRGLDRHVLQRGETAPARLFPRDDGDSYDSAGIVRPHQEVALVAQLGEVLGVTGGKVVRPAHAIGTEARLDLAMADIARIRSDYAARELGSVAGDRSGFVPSEGWSG